LLGGRAIIARLPNTPALISILNLALFSILLLAAALIRWPGRRNLVGWHGTAALAAWLSFVTLTFILIVSYEQYLPELVRTDGTFTPLVRVLAAFLLFLFAAGGILSTRYYLAFRDALAGYIAISQIAVFFMIVMTIIGGERYDLWWYLQRAVAAIGILVVMFGLLSEYVRLYHRENEGRLMLEAINKQLLESEQRYRSLFESMQEGLVAAEVITDENGSPVDYRYLDVNPATERLFGKSRDQFIGHTFKEVLPTAEPEWIDILGRVALTGEPLSLERYGTVTGLWFQTRAYSPRPGEFVHILTDITERKRAEAALQKHAWVLERANRDLRNFTVVAAHDLQEPLRKVEALGDAVLEGATNLDQRQVDRITRMRASARQMRNMVNGLHQLAFLATENQPFQRVNLDQVVVEITRLLEGNIHQLGAVVEINKLPVIEADPHQMRMLFLHLVENALKFQPREARPHVKIHSTHPGNGLVDIYVEDNGIGFDPSHAVHLFETFERLVGKNQSEYDGIGIGLTVCRWIVERHGGDITASSEPGCGSTFIIRLPIGQTYM
jgi:PAS domain S-box-containing protein